MSAEAALVERGEMLSEAREFIDEWITKTQKESKIIPKVRFMIEEEDNQYRTLELDLSQVLYLTKRFDVVIAEVLKASTEYSYIPIPILSESIKRVVETRRPDSCIRLNGVIIPPSLLIYISGQLKASEINSLSFSNMEISEELADAVDQNFNSIHELTFEGCGPSDMIHWAFSGCGLTVKHLVIKNCKLSFQDAKDILYSINLYMIQDVDYTGNGFDKDSPEWRSVLTDWERQLGGVPLLL